MINVNKAYGKMIFESFNPLGGNRWLILNPFQSNADHCVSCVHTVYSQYIGLKVRRKSEIEAAGESKGKIATEREEKKKRERANERERKRDIKKKR